MCSVSLTRTMIALGLTGAVTAAMGCAASSALPFDLNPPSDGGTQTGTAGSADGEPSDVDRTPDAPTSNYRGSPLCRVSTTAEGCMPDDTGTEVACYTDPPSTDGSTNVTDIQGCRLVRTDTDVAPECVAANLDGTDGRGCSASEECAPGFDCVAGAGGWVCRRYCCAGTCDDQVTQSGGPTFCDVQLLANSAITAPVCMPLKRCTLLEPGTCAEGETCAVVSDAGDTGCVTVGDAGAGAFCEDTHCATGLTCLGAPGNRKCYELCRVSDSTCSGGQTCKTSALFKDPTYGVCQT